MSSASPSPTHSSPISVSRGLTGRSRLDALLAQQNSGSEQEDSDSEPTTTTKRKVTQSTPAGRHATQSSSEPEDEVVRPRGRFAAQMTARAAQAKASGDSDESDDAEAGMTARERLRRKLLRPAETKQAENTADDNNNDATPKTKHRLKPRESTPSQQDSPGATASQSPGRILAFPTPKPPSKATITMSYSDEPDAAADEEAVAAVAKNPRVQALLERKRRERLAREAEEEAKRAARRTNAPVSDDDEDVDMGDVDDDIGDFLADAPASSTAQTGSTPKRTPGKARAASKKAMEEMNRETQRIQRNMQLTHEAKTRKKFDKKNLFAMFDFKPTGADDDADDEDEKSEMDKEKTPQKTEVQSDGVAAATSVLSPAGKENVDTPVVSNGTPGQSDKKRVRQVKIPDLKAESIMLDDGEIEIVDYSNDRLSKIAVPIEKMEPGMATLLQFVGKDEGHAMRLKKEKMESDLRRKAREQAKREHEAKIALLRSKGIHVPTEEEREREAAQVEDILAKAHEENERIRKRERERAKKNGELVDEVGLLDDDSDDESFCGSGDEEEEKEEEEEGAEPLELELSGSEDEEDQEDDENDQDDGSVSNSDEEEELAIKSRRPKKKKAQVLSDDEDENTPTAATDAIPPSAAPDGSNKVMQTPRPKAGLVFGAANANGSPAAPRSVLRSATKPFIPGVPINGPADMDLAEMFAGTLNESQDPDAMPPTFDGASMPDFSQNAFPMVADSQPDIIMATQESEAQFGSQNSGSKSQADEGGHSVETQGRVNSFSLRFLQGEDSYGVSSQQDSMLSQMSDLQVTQDQGLGDMKPLNEPLTQADASQRDGSVVPESPIAAKKNKSRLRSKEEAMAALESARNSTPRPSLELAPDAEKEAFLSPEDSADEFGFGTRSAADVLKEAARKQQKAEKKAKKLADAFDRKKSKASEMVDDQAEESDDEYAGLGGADGEFSDDDSDAASVNEMIDDETKASTAEERKVAAFFNERERLAEEAHVQKLYKDITTGGLRRKRGANYDLSDSESDGERRRRIKRRQFEKMQRELLANERIRKTAEAPGNEAYMRAIVSEYAHDEGSIIEMDMPTTDLDIGDTPSQEPVPLGTGALPLRKTKHKKERKPVTLQDVRSQLTELLDDPYERAAVMQDKLSDEEADVDANRADAIEVMGTPTDQDDIVAGPDARLPLRRAGSQVIDRLSLRRSASTLSTGSAGSGGAATGRMAFAAPGSSQGRTRSLLRGATSSLMSSAIANAAGSAGAGATGSTTSGGVGDAAPMRKGAVKGSGLSSFARENERRAALAETEKKREAKKLKGAEKRAHAIGGLFGAGNWE
ncbi:hypothetical protein BROUX41_001398 [Berkeleyomyces rouxiae]|uniref:uncharacterized protein n=1 Tax=Berkeleyomyces rouxiae TaxID=2035830 RepID=UPI003B7D2AA1